MRKKYEPKNRLTDKRVKKVVVFDTETAPYYEKDTNAKQLQLVFDIGWTVSDKKGNIFLKRNYLVKEIFTNMNLMKHAHYFSKYPNYLMMLQNNEIKMKKWAFIISKLEKDILDYSIKESYAFNIAFDKKAIENTHKILTNRKFLFWKANEMKTNCLWGMCAETIMAKAGYIKTAIEQGWLSESGNITTNAECAYRYITGIYDFEESHTALDDAIIETEIMARCFKTRMKMSFGIIPHPWKIVKGKAEALGLL